MTDTDRQAIRKALEALLGYLEYGSEEAHQCEDVIALLNHAESVADGARELSLTPEAIVRKIRHGNKKDNLGNVWFFAIDRHEAAALITQALREDRQKCAERAEDKLRDTWFDYKGVKIMVPLEIVEGLRAVILEDGDESK